MLELVFAQTDPAAGAGVNLRLFAGITRQIMRDYSIDPKARLRWWTVGRRGPLTLSWGANLQRSVRGNRYTFSGLALWGLPLTFPLRFVANATKVAGSDDKVIPGDGPTHARPLFFNGARSRTQDDLVQHPNNGPDSNLEASLLGIGENDREPPAKNERCHLRDGYLEGMPINPHDPYRREWARKSWSTGISMELDHAWSGGSPAGFLH